MNRIKLLWIASYIWTALSLLLAGFFRFVHPSSLWVPFFGLLVAEVVGILLISDRYKNGKIHRQTIAQAGIFLLVVGIAFLGKIL